MNLTRRLKQEDYPINVFNRQRRHQVRTDALREFLIAVYQRLQLQAGFSVVLISDAAMRDYHNRFAGKDRPTDVLSFPNEPQSFDQAYLGDILISVERALEQGEAGLQEELKALSLHGILHLLGYDHDSDEGEMERLERALRKEFGLQ